MLNKILKVQLLAELESNLFLILPSLIGIRTTRILCIIAVIVVASLRLLTAYMPKMFQIIAPVLSILLLEGVDWCPMLFLLDESTINGSL